VLWNQ